MTGLTRGDCPVQLRAGAVQGYALTPWTDVATVAVDRDGLLDIVWSPQERGRFGEESELPAPTDNSGGAVFAYAVADAGETGCSWKGSSGADERTLLFDAPGVCRVRLTGTKEHYEDWEWEHNILVRPGLITLTDTSDFGNPVKVGGQRRRPTGHSGLNPASADASWQLVRGEDDCEITDHNLGWVRALPEAFIDDENPMCSIQVVARKENYALFKSEPVDNRILKGDLGTLTAPVYGFGSTHLSVGGHAEMTSPPTESGGLPVTFAFEVAGADSGGTAKDGVCEVDASGRVSAGAEAQGDDTCTVTATVSSLGYNDKSAAAVVLTLKGAAAFASEPTFSYSGNLKMGDSAALAVDATGLDTQDGAVTWTFHVTGPCTVVAADGQLSLGADANAGDVCLVSATGASAGNADYITETVRVPVDKGELDFTNGGSNLANYMGKNLRLEGSVNPAVPATAPTTTRWRLCGAVGVWRVSIREAIPTTRRTTPPRRTSAAWMRRAWLRPVNPPQQGIFARCMRWRRIQIMWIRMRSCWHR